MTTPLAAGGTIVGRRGMVGLMVTTPPCSMMPPAPATPEQKATVP